MSIFGRRSESQSTPVTPQLGRESNRVRPKRCLVIGSEGHGRDVTAYRWDKLPKGINVADYDVVLLNFAAFEADEGLARGFPLDRLPAQEAMTRLLFAPGSEIVAIGDPGSLIGAPADPAEPRSVLYDPRERADYWLPFSLPVEKNEGRSYDVLDQDWEPYFGSLSSYRWIAAGSPQAKYSDATRYLSPTTEEANDLRLRLDPIAVTRFGKAIALRIELAAIRAYRYNPPGGPAIAGGVAEGAEIVHESSPVFWLPAPDAISTEEAIDLILRERYALTQEARRPEWVQKYALPAETLIATEIEGLEQRRQALERDLDDARERAARARQPSGLLYEKGKEPLEPIVRAALRELGAEVKDPEQEGIEDGLLRASGAAAVLEIKGRKNQISQDDVRQVVQWASDAEMREGVRYKPIIVGNPNCEAPPSERGEPLSPKGLQYAQNSGVALLSTLQIYEALRQKQEGEFDPERFWATVFGAVGPVEVPSVEGGRPSGD